MLGASAESALRQRLGQAAATVQVVEADERPAFFVLDPLQLEPGIVNHFTAVGDGVLDRREFEKIVLAFPRTAEHQQHKPDWLQPIPPNALRRSA